MKILVRLPNWLGDLMMSTAFLQALRAQYPSSEIHVIVKKEIAPLVSLFPWIQQIHVFSKNEHPGLKGVIAFGKTLRQYEFSLFFSLPDSFSSALMGWTSRASHRIGYKHEWRSFLLTSSYRKRKHTHRVLEYLHLLERYAHTQFTAHGVGFPPPRVAGRERKIIVNFNSEASSRRLPVDKAVSLANRLIADFPAYAIAFIGSPREKEFIDHVLQLATQAPNVQNLAGKTNLTELVGVLASSRAMLSTDSGPAHLANGVGIPVVVLFGAGNEQNTAPFNKDKLTVVRAGKLPCEPCTKNKCPLYDIPKCMSILDEDLIIAKLREFAPHDGF